MSDGDNKTSPLLDEYLDGLLTDDARRAFERKLEENEQLRAAARAHRLIEESLARVFGNTGDAAFLDNLAASPRLGSTRSENPRTSLHGVRRRSFAIAAVLGLLLFSGWANREALLSSRFGRVIFPSARFDIASLYSAEITKGFRPRLICETDDQFRTLMFGRFGQALVMQRSPGVSAIGWSYSELISPRTLHLLATIEPNPAAEGGPPGAKLDEAKHVLVFFDRVGAGPAPQLSARSGLHLFHRVLGGVDAYEITPLNAPRILDLLRIPS